MRRCLTALIATTLLALAPSFAWSDVVRVGLEPFPPLVNANGTGYTVDLLKALEQHTDLQFQVNIMSYQRAKIELEKGNIDLIGHTPWGYESPIFYEYAKELSLKVPTRLDIFALSPEHLTLTHSKEHRIGTPPGNAEFMAELTQTPLKQFIESPLNSLVNMLFLKRIDAILFERSSVLTTLEALQKHPAVHRKTITSRIFAGLAVADTPRGVQLAHSIDQALKTIDQKAVYSSYLERYVNASPTAEISQPP